MHCVISGDVKLHLQDINNAIAAHGFTSREPHLRLHHLKEIIYSELSCLCRIRSSPL